MPRRAPYDHRHPRGEQRPSQAPSRPQQPCSFWPQRRDRLSPCAQRPTSAPARRRLGCSPLRRPMSRRAHVSHRATALLPLAGSRSLHLALPAHRPRDPLRAGQPQIRSPITLRLFFAHIWAFPAKKKKTGRTEAVVTRGRTGPVPCGSSIFLSSVCPFGPLKKTREPPPDTLESLRSVSQCMPRALRRLTSHCGHGF